MKKHLHMFFALAVAASLLLSACGPRGGEMAASNLQRVTDPDAAPAELDELVAGDNAFAFDLYQTVRSSDGNLFYSPYSISLALAMTYAGARGETASQMAATLHFTLPDDRLHSVFNALDLDLARRPEQASDVDKDQRFELSIVNSLWGQTGWPFLPEYLDLLALNYGAGMRLVDYMTAPEEARLAINDWVSEQTKARIKDLVPQGLITPDTTLVLVNAIYFKAAWQYEFDNSQTKDGPFTLLDASQVSAPLMSLEHPASLGYASGEGWQAMILPYKGGMTEMVIIVPDEGWFTEFEASLSADRFDEILVGMEPKMVALTMPKFSFTSSYQLKDVLSGMGMPLAFDDQLADLSGIDGRRDLFIRDVVHKAFVAVDEAGTEAAASTAVIIAPTAMLMPDVELTIDRPFFFVIRDVPTGSILFVGRAVNPVPDSE
jgi:serpin B